MNKRYVNSQAEGDGPLGLEPELVELLRQTPAIRRDVAELRHLLMARRKSHFTVEEFAVVVERAPYTVRIGILQSGRNSHKISGAVDP
jgi:hypothetical protein